MRWLGFLLVLATPATAVELTFPGAEVVTVESTEAGTARLPDTVWTPGTVTPGTEGALRKTVLEVPSDALTSLQLIEPLREALLAEGYDRVFACADAECGGFDFRFQLDLIGEPRMHVDLGDYRYLLFAKDGAEPHLVSLVASPGVSSGFIHITEVFNAVFPELKPRVVQPLPETADPIGSLIDGLVAQGHAVLGDLEFETGSSALGAGPYASLDELATWLATNPSARIVLVGHTDAVGSLEANTSLSRQRATSVAERLVSSFGADSGQIQSAGAGYLAPVASNLTPEGRATNRRVEVVLLSLD